MAGENSQNGKDPGRSLGGAPTVLNSNRLEHRGNATNRVRRRYHAFHRSVYHYSYLFSADEPRTLPELSHME